MPASIVGPVCLVFWCLFAWTAAGGWTFGWFLAFACLLVGTVSAITTIARRAMYQPWLVTVNWVMLVVSAAPIAWLAGLVLLTLSIIGLHG